EGNLISNNPTPNSGDWIQGDPGTGGYVLDASGEPIDISRTIRVTDPYDSNGDNIFTGGAKFNQNPNTAWSWTTGKATGKGDIDNVFLHIGEDAVNKQWLIIASDRLSTNGASYIDCEFLQKNLTVNPEGTFTSAGQENGRTTGDLLITVEYTNGGSTATVKFYLWNGSD